MVFGTIHDPDFTRDPDPSLHQQRMDAAGNIPGPNEPKPDGSGNCTMGKGTSDPCEYIQGWFILPAGKDSDSYLGMTDADAVRGYNGQPLYDFWGTPYNPQNEEYKLDNNSIITVRDVQGKPTIWSPESKPGSGFFDWLGSLAEFYRGRSGWGTCEGGCDANALNFHQYPGGQKSR